jgi:hypothetical protein
MLAASCASASWRSRQPSSTPADRSALVCATALVDAAADCLARSCTMMWLTPRIELEADVHQQLHPSLQAELESLLVVAHVVPTTRRDQSNESGWSVRLDASGPTDAATEERLVSMRDSLCFLHRAVGLPYLRSEVLLALGLPQSTGTDDGSDNYPLQHRSIQRRPHHRQRPTPMDRRHDHRMKKLERKILSAGGDLPSDGPSSWRRRSE